MLIERCVVSRKTPLDGMLEISAQAAACLEALGATFPLRTVAGDGSARLRAMSCTCNKTAGPGQHQHHFVESDLLRALDAGSQVRIELDDARPGSLTVEPERDQ